MFLEFLELKLMVEKQAEIFAAISIFLSKKLTIYTPSDTDFYYSLKASPDLKAEKNSYFIL